MDVSGGEVYHQQSVTQAGSPVCACDLRTLETIQLPSLHPASLQPRAPFLHHALCHSDSQPFRACQHGPRSSSGDKAVPRATASLTLDG